MRSLDDPIWNEPTGTDHPRRHLVAIVVPALALTLVLGYSLIASVLSRRDYGTFGFWRLPDRINYCGRRYYRGLNVHANPASLTAHDDGNPNMQILNLHWQTVARTFTLRAIDAPVFTSSETPVCTMDLYVSVGGASYASYGLSGSP